MITSKAWRNLRFMIEIPYAILRLIQTKGFNTKGVAKACGRAVSLFRMGTAGREQRSEVRDRAPEIGAGVDLLLPASRLTIRINPVPQFHVQARLWR